MSDDNHDDFRLRRGPDPDEEALFWLVRMTSGEVTDAERAEFGRWRAVRANAAAYAELDGIWDGIGKAFERPDNVVALRPKVRRISTWERRAAAAAAILLFAATSQQYLVYGQYDATTRGSARGHEELADGSRIELNTGSALDVNYGADARRVTLARGEAFFDVKHDASKPFIIEAGGGEVRVLGTAFSVERQGEGAKVTVIRGKVRVASAGHYVDIVPNQQVAFANGALQPVHNVDAASVLAWSQGRLVLHNRSIADVIRAVDRYYPGTIILSGNVSADRRIDAIVDLNAIDGWLEALEKSQKLKVRRLPGLAIITNA